MAEDHGSWDALTLDERIRRNYPVDEETVHLIARKYLTLALTDLEPGVTVREAYTGRQLRELLDQAAEMVLLRGLPKQS
jgi:hypothetical protein